MLLTRSESLAWCTGAKRSFEMGTVVGGKVVRLASEDHAELHQRVKIRRDASAAVLCLNWLRKVQRNYISPSLSETYHT
jgi:hypothetical protein